MQKLDVRHYKLLEYIHDHFALFGYAAPVGEARRELGISIGAYYNRLAALHMHRLVTWNPAKEYTLRLTPAGIFWLQKWPEIA